MLDEIESTPEGENNKAFESDYGESLAMADAGTKTYPHVHRQRRVAFGFIDWPIAVQPPLRSCFPAR